MGTDPGCGDFDAGGELAGVGDRDFQEDRSLGKVEVVVNAYVEGLLDILRVVPGLHLVGDEPHRRVHDEHLVKQLLGRGVEGDLLDA